MKSVSPVWYLIVFLISLTGFKPFKSLTIADESIAFPGAEGYGKYAIGGRGGQVYIVSNLNDAGVGSLRAAIEAKGPRTIVFGVSGTIPLNSTLRITNPNITIAGQTAPGDGICIKNFPIIIDASQVIIRYLRVRLGGESGIDGDAVSGRFNKNIILDHISVSWSVDETMSIYHCDSLTVQWCIISESMYQSNHVKGNHGFGGIWGSNHGSYHHNLLAHHSSRNPRFASGSQYTDYRNNVLYNWGYQSSYGGEKYQKDNASYDFTQINMVANYYKPGPATRPGEVSYRIVNPSTHGGAEGYGKWYVAENFIEGNTKVSTDNWNGGVQPQTGVEFIPVIKMDKAWPALAIEQQSAAKAYELVLKNAGAILPKRDVVDYRIVEETQKGVANYEGATYKIKSQMVDKSKKSGIIDSPEDVGGWPLLKSVAAPLDSDLDGMPDNWEVKQGLDPKNPNDRNKIGKGGYTMLEVFMNGL